MVLSALVSMGITGVFPWVAIIIVALKELLMVVGGAYMLKAGVVVYANYYGKTATVLFIIALILAFFHEELAGAGVPLDQVFLWASVSMALAAMGVYAVQAARQLRGMKK